MLFGSAKEYCTMYSGSRLIGDGEMGYSVNRDEVRETNSYPIV